MNILVTGVGAIIGYGIVNSLRMTGRELNIIGMDIYPDAVGQKFCNSFILSQYANSPDYLDFLFDIIQRQHIDLVFFGTEQELYRVSDARDQFSGCNVKLVLNSKEVIDLSKDKLKTYEFLSKHGQDTIPTLESGSFQELKKNFGLPFILKLRCSYASKGVFKIDNETDFNYWTCKAKKDFIFQKLVGDDDHEYTVAVFGGRSFELATPFVMRRRLSKEGATVKAIVEKIPELNEKTRALTKLLQPIGPINFQFRRENEKFLLLEINPRISSSTSIRAAFGYNEAEMCIRYYFENSPIVMPTLKSGTAIRFISDWINYADCPDI